MRYVSTRGAAPVLGFSDVLLAGLADDGGLYLPSEWPVLPPLEELRGLTYAEVASKVMWPFIDGDVDEDGDPVPGAVDREAFEQIVADAYATFDTPDVCPVVPLGELGSSGPDLHLLELFRGPTLAFKDVALQLVGRLFDHVLSARGDRVCVLGATSGDTGSAAMHACAERSCVDIVILFPDGRTSEVQRRQMTTLGAANAHAVALPATFDDCQDLVKAMFNDGAFRDELALSAVNSINWARIMAQIVYYVTAAVALGAPDRRIAFGVPTGNFGNVYSAYGARAMGLPIEKLIIGSNRNDILDRFFKSGEMRVETVVPTISPSMDIQVSSNFERLLFDLHDRDGERLSAQMADFRATGAFRVTPDQLAKARALFDSHRLDDDGIRATIAETLARTGQLVDPHTAVGLAAARQCRVDADVAVVSLACAHPAKFPEAVERASGRVPALPPRLADLFDRPERTTVLPNDLTTIQQHIRRKVAAKGEGA